MTKELSKDLTPDQKKMIEKFQGAKKEMIQIVAPPLKDSLEIGESAFLQFIGSEIVKKSENVEKDFTAYLLFDPVFENYYTVSGVIMDKANFEVNRYYKITYNGEMDTGTVNRFNAWIVEALPKDFKL